MGELPGSLKKNATVKDASERRSESMMLATTRRPKAPGVGSVEL